MNVGLECALGRESPLGRTLSLTLVGGGVPLVFHETTPAPLRPSCLVFIEAEHACCFTVSHTAPHTRCYS